MAVLIPFLDALNVTLEAFVATAIPLSDTSLAKLAAFVKDEAVIRAFFVTCVVTLPAICGIISHTAFVNLVICHVLLVFAAGSLVTICLSLVLFLCVIFNWFTFRDLPPLFVTIPLQGLTDFGILVADSVSFQRLQFVQKVCLPVVVKANDGSLAEIAFLTENMTVVECLGQ